MSVESFDATLDLTTRGLGLSIVGGTDAPARPDDSAIYISRVNKSGAAVAAGLRVGDRITQVGSFDLTHVSHDEAINIIKEELGSLSITLHVERDPAALDHVEIVRNPSEDAANVDGKSRSVVARKAFKSGDKELSKLAHETLSSDEQHMKESGQYIKAAVFGGLDGIITTFAVVASVAGANLSTGIVIIMGFSNLIADGISMGFGEFVSMQSEKDYVQAERNREEWEYDNGFEGEVKEMVELYMEKGFSKKEAEGIISVMAGHKDFFIDHMMVQELGMMPPDPEESAWKSGLVMFFSFLIFGLIPLLSYLAFSTINFPSNKENALFAIACVLTAVALFALGAIKSKFSTQSWWRSGLWVLLNGTLAAAAAYLIGFGLEALVGGSICDDTTATTTAP
jgi:DNA damage-binding protein 1